jgi:hypothetical protein
MVSKKRRFIIILVSVSAGSLISLWIIKQRLGTLSTNDYFSLAVNFFFAAALVVGLSIFLQRMNDKYDKEENE